MIVGWRRAALTDRAEAIAYLRQRNPDAARKILQNLIRAAQNLAHFPETGRPGELPGTRELVTVPPYVIIYRVDHQANRVSILRLWHAAQNRKEDESGTI